MNRNERRKNINLNSMNIRASNKSGSHRDCLRFALNESREHAVLKLLTGHEIMKRGRTFYSECIFRNGTRADIYDIEQNDIFEVLDTETGAEFEKKIQKYPRETKCYAIGITDETKQELKNVLDKVDKEIRRCM